ncbi:glycosyltransferase family 2 protein [Shewanella indica]|uniref:glycosyltransferase family 2 protein n=1 Tax=Shewanella indica TaxID=768528 RepID=UPI00399BFE42
MNINTTKKNDKQIVTVAVITYHSAATVLETLDSILNQSYGPENVELIISDDGSKDTTVLVINDWLAQHQAKFHSVKFFANEVNSGISKNCNVAWKAATSEWIKTIAGDDILLPNCLADNVEFVLEHNDIAVLFSKMQSFKVTENGLKQNLAILPTARAQQFFELPALKQFHYLQRQGISGAPSAFINRVKLASIGFADERFKMMEDFPLWFNFTRTNNMLHFMDKMTVEYRLTESVSHSSMKLINEVYFNEIIKVEIELVAPTLSSQQKILKFRKWFWPYLVVKIAKLFDNKVTLASRLFITLAFMIRPGTIKSILNKIVYR